MCGILGYTAGHSAFPVVVEGMSHLEYRGYDSVGIAAAEGGELRVKKGVGRVKEVIQPFDGEFLSGGAAIGHVRWASYGEVSKKNAHPFVSCDSRIAVAHNGFVTNHAELRKSLEAAGHSFTSTTDSEVIVHLMEDAYAKTMDPLYATRSTMMQLQGDNAFIAIFSIGGIITGSRKGMPLIIGVGKDRMFASSDVVGFLKWTDRAVFIEDWCSFMLTRYSYRIVDQAGDVLVRQQVQLPWEYADAELGDHEHYTMKEIDEQATVLARIARQPKRVYAGAAGAIDDAMNVVMVGAGSSYNAALFFRNLLDMKYGARFYAMPSGEFRLMNSNLGPKDVVVAFSQSGETADTLDAIRGAKKKGAKVLSFVNVPGSTMVRESDITVPLLCGPEIGVAATKSFVAQLATSARVLDGIVNVRLAGDVAADVQTLLKTELSPALALLYGKNDVYIIGSGLGHPIALEGALKVKELALVHAEGLLSSEFKHGPLAVIREGTPVIAVDVGGQAHAEVVAAAEQLKARGAKIIGITNSPDSVYDVKIQLPSQDEVCAAMESVVPLQLLAYKLALHADVNPDYPRNLAKSVTVR